MQFTAGAWPVPRCADFDRATAPGGEPACSHSSWLRRHRRHPLLVRRASATRSHRQRRSGRRAVRAVRDRVAIGRGHIAAAASTRLLVYLGQVSFSLYMVHELVHTAWNWAAQQFEILPAGTAAKWIVAGLLAAAMAAAMPLYHFVEEPARRWMRRMVDVREAAAADLGPCRARGRADRHQAGALRRRRRPPSRWRRAPDDRGRWRANYAVC